MRLLNLVLPYVAWLFSIVLTLLDWMALRSLVRSVVIQVLAAMPTEQRVERRLHPSLLIPATDFHHRARLSHCRCPGNAEKAIYPDRRAAGGCLDRLFHCHADPHDHLNAEDESCEDSLQLI